MALNDVKLLGTWVCPYVNRAQLALKLKSIDHEFIDDIHFKKNEMLLKYNPVHKKIPVLVHGDKPVCESLIIVEYVDNAWPNSRSILPSDAYERALARFWAAYIDEKWFLLVKVLREAEDIEERASLAQKISEGLVVLEEAFVRISKGETYFGGKSIGYLDIILGSCLAWLRVTEKIVQVNLLDQAKTPKLAKWADSFCSDDDVKDILPDTQKLLEFYKQVQVWMKAK
ncbi:glutathione S-transferase U17-like [Andrographis paniculata]|uniref:glutathione S-transferase U17-like n=1 Tax=Andrographis paniculata TaxID=175694 RepID=UPI0021E80B60|nr:glutathione S-transferase U17-like [Andrographis paniculata]